MWGRRRESVMDEIINTQLEVSSRTPISEPNPVKTHEQSIKSTVTRLKYMILRVFHLNGATEKCEESVTPRCAGREIEISSKEVAKGDALFDYTYLRGGFAGFKGFKGTYLNINLQGILL